MPKSSIIVRTKNEERWIAHCLSMLFAQKNAKFEVILVDNNSTDHTVQVAKRFPISRLLNIDEFKPGLALNQGIRQSTGEYVICLSAHCIPRDEYWLATLIENFENQDVAGVYGRQLPLAFTEAIDKRDMLIVFGEDKRLQVKDCFFHNANSAVRRDVWEKIPFDEDVANIEDRVWGKAVIEAGYNLVYEPDAAVYHHHGIHQGNDTQRAQGVVSIIDRIDSDVFNSLPESLLPENCLVAAVVPVLGDVLEIGGRNLLEDAINQLRQSNYVSSIYILAKDISGELAGADDVKILTRPDWLNEADKGVEDVLKYALTQIESQGEFPEAILYLNHKFPFRPPELIDNLIMEAQFKGLDTIFPGYVDFHTYWYEDEDSGFAQVGVSLEPRNNKKPLYRALYGLGCLTSAAVVRKGHLVGERIGIVPIDDRLAAMLFSKDQSGDPLEQLVRDIVS